LTRSSHTPSPFVTYLLTLIAVSALLVSPSTALSLPSAC
jgi:hypothetical protein